MALSTAIDLNEKRFSKTSYLKLAGEAGRRDICEILVRNGANPNEVNGPRQYSLLHNAAASFNYGFASILLQLGAFPSPQTTSGATPLHFATRTGQQYLAEKLLKHDADPTIEDSAGRTPIVLAPENGNASATFVGEAKVLACSFNMNRRSASSAHTRAE